MNKSMKNIYSKIMQTRTKEVTKRTKVHKRKRRKDEKKIAEKNIIK